ncbi:MAG TPA: Glu-tRNA(Gln) amidotransferase GatDE subunit D, partial [Candidatus Diapherotrites archaeon]|nr:Glu-tRNA(Gln) amidotransferase GatDE subunit D [Candidatus Diapherotrites archaeon]
MGSQRSSDRGSSDAAINLLCAAEFIKQTDFAGVAICMHETSDDQACVVLPGTKARKMHTSRRDAFKAVNDQPIARVHFNERRVEYLKKDYPRVDKKKPFTVKDGFEEKVGLLKSHPNMHPEEILFYLEHGFKGLVVEGTGMGHMPTNTPENLPNYEALKKLIASGCVVVMTAQCLYGRVHPYVYTNLRRLSEIGVVFAEDLLPETAFVKLAWLLGNFKREEAVKKVP